MWRWLRKNTRKRYLVFFKLGACCAVAHSIFLISFFVLYRDTIHAPFITLHTSLDSDVSILFLPPKIAEHVQSNNVVAPTSVQKTSVKQPKKVVKKKTIPKKSPDKKQLQKKTALVTKSPQKNEIKKVQKKEPVKKNDKVSDNTSKKTVPNKKVNKVVPEHKISNQVVKTIPVLSEQNALDYRTNETLKQKLALQKEFERCWRPPAGIASDCCCEITVHLSQKGMVTDVNITKKSGVLLFDVAARKTVYEMNFPQWVWNNSLQLQFKP